MHTLHLRGTQNKPEKQYIVLFAASRWFGTAGISESKWWLWQALDNLGIVVRFKATKTDLSFVDSIQTGSEARSNSCLKGTETLSPWWGSRRLKLATHPHLVRRLRVTGTIPRLPHNIPCSYTKTNLSLCLRQNISTVKMFRRTQTYRTLLSLNLHGVWRRKLLNVH